MREQVRNSKEGRGWQQHVTSERQLDLGYGMHPLPEQHPRHLLGTSWAPPGTVSTGRRRGAGLALRMSATTKTPARHLLGPPRNSLHRCSRRRGADLALRMSATAEITYLIFTTTVSAGTVSTGAVVVGGQISLFLRISLYLQMERVWRLSLHSQISLYLHRPRFTLISRFTYRWSACAD